MSFYCAYFEGAQVLLFCFLLLCLTSNVFKADDLGKDIALIALPALVALAADPLSSLVDTAFVGQIGNIF